MFLSLSKTEGQIEKKERITISLIRTYKRIERKMKRKTYK